MNAPKVKNTSGDINVIIVVSVVLIILVIGLYFFFQKDDDIEKITFKEVKRLLGKKVRNTRAKQWIEMEMKRRGITRAPKGF